MVSVLIITQGHLADELVDAAARISGTTEHLTALSLDWNDDVEVAVARIDAAVERLESPEGLLILTDIFGGTPYNLATRHFRPGRVEILAGVNLPIVVRLACMENATRKVGELAEWIAQKGRDSVCLGGLPEQPKELCRPVAGVPIGQEDGRG